MTERTPTLHRCTGCGATVSVSVPATVTCLPCGRAMRQIPPKASP